jgi:adenylate kinase
LFQNIKNEMALDVLPVGDVVRANIKKNTPLGREAHPFASTGSMVPDALIQEMILQQIESFDSTRAWGVDGFPRVPSQVPAYVEMIGEKKRYDIAVYLQLGETPEESEEIARERIRERVEWCLANGIEVRDDDTDPDIIDRRMQEARKLFSVLDELEQNGKMIITIDARQAAERLLGQMRQLVIPLLKDKKNVSAGIPNTRFDPMTR